MKASNSGRCCRRRHKRFFTSTCEDISWEEPVGSRAKPGVTFIVLLKAWTPPTGRGRWKNGTISLPVTVLTIRVNSRTLTLVVSVPGATDSVNRNWSAR